VNALVLHNPNPTCKLPVTRAQPDVVCSGKSNLHRKVRSDPVWVLELLLEIISQFAKARLCVLVGYSPFRGVLWVLSKKKIDEDFIPVD